MNPNDFIGVAGTPFVVALTQLVKVTFPDIPARWFPSISVVWGVGVNVGLAFVLNTDKPIAVLVGVATGLLASGLYAVGKRGE
jgi:hypothetical protein